MRVGFCKGVQQIEPQSPGDGFLRPAIRGIGLAVLLAIVPVCLWYVPGVQALLGYMRYWAHMPYAPFFMLPLATLYCACGLPRQALCLALGAGLGVVEGLVEASIAYTLGALIGYGWGRLLACKRPLVRQASIPWFVQAGVEAPFRAILGARLLPVGSALLVSVSAGVLALPVLRFLIASFFGGLPQNITFVLVGSGVHVGHSSALYISFGLAVSSAVLSVGVVRRFRKAKVKNDKEV